MNNNRGMGGLKERGGYSLSSPEKEGLIREGRLRASLGDIVKFARPNRRAYSQARISRLPFALNGMLNFINKELKKAVNEYPSALPGKGP